MYAKMACRKAGKRISHMMGWRGLRDILEELTMKCPYVYTALNQIIITVNDAEDGRTKQILQEVYDYQECKQKECGAWHKGRCRYKE